MEIEKLKRNSDDRKTIQVKIMISKRMSKWLKEKDLSPTKIFNAACKELGYGDDAK